MIPSQIQTEIITTDTLPKTKNAAIDPAMNPPINMKIDRGNKELIIPLLLDASYIQQ
jgi:hypothetical protein